MSDRRPEPELFAGADAGRADGLVPDVEISVSAFASEVRHLEPPQAHMDGGQIDETRRANLPRRVKAGETYTDVRISRRVGARLSEARSHGE